MTRKYRNGKASGEPKRDLKYSPEYLAYRQSRGGESIKVSQCDLDLDGTPDSIVSAWRHPAVGKVEHCGDPYLFWPVTGISTLLNPHSPPTSVQTLASPQGDQSPTGISLQIDMDEDGVYAGPNNLPPYDFDDNDDTVGAITLLNSADQGPTGISLQIDMDEDGVYAPDDFDDNDGSVGILVPGNALTIVPKTGNIDLMTNVSVADWNGAVYAGNEGTVNLGGIYEVDGTSSGYKQYKRTHKFDVTNHTFVVDTDNPTNRSKIFIINNYYTSWTNTYYLNHGFDPDTDFTFGGILDASLIHPTGGGSNDLQPSFQFFKRGSAPGGMDLGLMEGQAFAHFYGAGSTKLAWYHITSVYGDEKLNV